MKHVYALSGVCSTEVSFELREGAVYGLRFAHGCDGNLKAIGLLAEGMEAAELIRRLKGVCCGRKDTSCPDLLARCLEQALALEREPARAQAAPL